MRTNFTCKLLLISCLLITGNITAKAQHAGTVDTSNVREIRINPGAALAESVVADDIFASVDYIPLETTPKSLFGNITQMELLDGNFIIFEEQATVTTVGGVSTVTSAILIFGSDGKFKNRMDIEQCQYITVDPVKKEILSYNGEQIAYYNQDGKQLRKEPLLFNAVSFVFTTTDKLAVYRRNRSDYLGFLKKSNAQFNNLVVFNPDKSVSSSYLPFDPAAKSMIPITRPDVVYFNRSGQEIFMNQLCTPYVLSLEKEKLIKKYNFVLPLENTLSLNPFTADRTTVNNYMAAHPSAVISISAVYKTGNILTFALHTYHGLYTPRPDRENYFYNLKNNVLTALSSVKTNSTNVIVPFTNTIIASDGNLMYTWLKAAPFFSEKHSIAEIMQSDKALAAKLLQNHQTYLNINPSENYKGNSDKLKQFIKEGSARSNPVLVMLKVI